MLWYLLENEWAEKQMKNPHILDPYVELIFFFSFQLCLVAIEQAVVLKQIK